MRITIGQINPTIGDIEGNVSKLLDVIQRGAKDNADLVVLPELAITGYPPQDLLERPAFIDQAEEGLDRVTSASKEYPGVGIILGCPVRTGLEGGKALYNSAILISEGTILFEQPKILLPTYDVFYEARHFLAATDNKTFRFKDVELGLSVCEDLWFEPDRFNPRPYPCDPIEMLAEKGAGLVINISASPFSVGKEQVRYDLIRNHTIRHKVPFLFVNQVGGNDDLVFDGTSLFVDSQGRARVVCPSFEEDTRTIDTDNLGEVSGYVVDDPLDTILHALVLGTRDYLAKCGIGKVVIGLSGGIDSAVTAVVAYHAVGAENVTLISMPSEYTSSASIEDARAIASNLGVELKIIPIDDVVRSYKTALSGVFEGREEDVTEENIQARVRGNYLMAYSNKFDHLPLSTGNKSELAVGYCTLYGDMSGGLAVISDVPKTVVYDLARRMNSDREIIPLRVIDRPPSAELKPDQTDQDTLPPYPVLDQVLAYYVDQHLSSDEIVAKGLNRDTVAWVTDAVRKNEYKRKQAAPGLKVTSKAFGGGRRMPIAARYTV